jgi:hypothetical protein
MKSTKQEKLKQQALRKAQKRGLIERIMSDTVLSSSAKIVAWALLHKFHNNENDRCNPGFPAIAGISGLSRRTVITAIAELRDGGWIAVKSIGGGSKASTNRYEFDWERTSRGANSARVQGSSVGVQTSAREPLRTTLSLSERESVCAIIPFQRAPDGALVREESKFQTLCSIWRAKPDGIDPKAEKAFFEVCNAGAEPDEILASAQNWVAKTEPRWLPKLEKWLGNGAWQNEPIARRAQRGPGGKQSLVAIAREYGGV